MTPFTTNYWYGTTSVAALYAAGGGAPATTPAQDLVDTWASGGAGSDGFAMVFEDAAGTDAPSIYVKDSGTPANDTDINLTDDFSAFNSFLTYTSPSPKIVRQSDGNLKYCAHNLLVAGTDEFDNTTYWSTIGTPTLTPGQPDSQGGSTACTFAASGSVNTYIATNGSVAVQNGADYTFEIDVKYNSGSGWIFLFWRVAVWFDVQNGSVGTAQSGASGTITSLGGGWYRCTITDTSAGTAYNPRIELCSADNNSTATSGDSVDIGRGHFYRTPSDTTYLETNGTTNGPRYALPIQHDSSNNAEGLLVEPAATNLLVESRDFTTYTTSNASVTADEVGIDGETNSAHTLLDSGASGTGEVRVQFASPADITISASTTYCLSVFAKADQVNFLALRTGADFSDGPSNSVSYFNLSTGAVVSTGANHVSAGIQAASNGFYRCYIVITTATDTAGTFTVNACQIGTSLTADLDGTTSIIIDQIQVETGSVPTSPIITTGATATRAVDDLNKALTAIEHSATAGTLYAKYVPRGVATSRDIVRLDDGTANEVVSIGQTSGAAARLTVTDGGAAQTAPLTSGTVVAAADNKVAASWAANDFAISEGGAAASTDTSGTLPTVTTFDVGAVNGLVKEVLHLPEAMSDSDLASITT